MENKDTKIFQLRDNAVETKLESIEITEKQLQNFYEKNLDKLLRARLVKSELSFRGGRIDTFALDYHNNPIIIEYKKSGKSSVLQQALHYKKNIEDNSEKGYVAILKKLGEEVADKANLKNIQIVLVAQKFDKWTLSLASYHDCVRLYEYSFFKNIFIQKRVNVNQKNNFYIDSKIEEDKDLFESKETPIEKEIGNENELIDVWIESWFDKKIIKAKYINKNVHKSILFLEETFFTFKANSKNMRIKTILKSELLDKKKKGKIDWNDNLDPMHDKIEIKILKNSTFSASFTSWITKGKSTRGNEEIKDNNGVPILKYIEKRNKSENDDELVSVSMQNWHDRQIIEAKYVRESKKILVDKAIFFDFKLRARNKRDVFIVTNKLNSYKETGKIEYEDDADLLNAKVKIKINEGAIFPPSRLAVLLQGRDSGGWWAWKDADGDPIKKYKDNK